MRKHTGSIYRMTKGQQQEVVRWLFDETPPLTYTQARERLLHDFGLETSEAVLCRFYQATAKERLMERIAASATRANVVSEQLRQRPTLAFQALMELIGRAALNAGIASEEFTVGQLKELAQVAALGVKACTDEAQVEVWRREVALKETRYKDMLAAAKAKKEAEEAGIGEDRLLTPEELARIEKEAHII